MKTFSGGHIPWVLAIQALSLVIFALVAMPGIEKDKLNCRWSRAAGNYSPSLC